MGLYSGGLIIRRIFASEIRGGGGGGRIFGTWEGLSGAYLVIFDREGQPLLSVIVHHIPLLQFL